jgi:predicted transcriptional regulator
LPVIDLPLDDTAPEIVEFVDKYIDRFAAWDVFAYFHENPDAEKKCSGVAIDVGRRVTGVATVLENLVELGVLARDEDESGEHTYRYDANAEVRNRMEAFMAATRDRTNRLAIVSRVLQKEARRL